MNKSFAYSLSLFLLVGLFSCRHDAMYTIVGKDGGDIPLHTQEEEDDTGKEPGCIRLVQYNVGNFYKSGSSSLPMVVDMLTELEADLVSLNEVDSVVARSGSIDQMKAFSTLLGNWNYRYAYAIYYGGGKYGSGACASPSFNYVKGYVVHLPKGSGVEDRSLAVMEFDDFIFSSTHLDLNTTEQLSQIDVINDFFDIRYTDSPKPIFICGDFNNYPYSETIKKMQKSWTLITPTNSPTFPALNPSVCIDYIFVRPGNAKVSVVKSGVCKVFNSGDVTVASDHLPVYADVLIQ